MFMEDKRKKFKKKLYFKITQIILILIIVFVTCFVFSGKIKKESKELIEERKTSQDILLRNQAMVGMYKEYKNAKPYIEKLENIHLVAEKENLVEIISLLEKTAQDTGNVQIIKLKDSQPVPEISKEGVAVEKMNYIITLSGNFDSLVEYLKQIKELPYYIKFEYINIYGPVEIKKNSQTVLGASFYLKK
jgi:hypothetical protein